MDALTGLMFPFQNREAFPQVEDLSDDERAALPPNVTHIEVEEFNAFGKICHRKVLWTLGNKRKLRYNKDEKRWVS